jgi:RNA polymerase sigma factor (sigma-70 family)
MTWGRRRSQVGEGLRSRTDDELLVAARTDPEAFGVLFDRHYADVLRFFVLRVRSPETAADLCAETLAAALDGVDRFDPARGIARQWIYGIARHKLARYWRDLRVTREARDRLGITAITIDDDSVRAIARAEADADSDAIFAALRRLPPDQAAAVRLRVVEELDYPEIAHRLDCNEGTVRVRVHRGLRRLEAEFGVVP